MNTPVYILVTVRNPALLPAALLVFKTLRVGFPDAPVHVYGNGLRADHQLALADAAQATGAACTWVRMTAHDLWVEQLLQRQAKPFWICDPDVVFLNRVPEVAGFLCGRFEPAFNEEWTKSVHVERLHTALMLLDPMELRARMTAWQTNHVPPIFPNAETHFVRQHFVPRVNQPPLFYDTLAGAYHAFGGGPFNDEANDCFEHLHCGSYSDLISKCEGLKDLPAVHAAIVADVNAARGLQVAQANYYALRKGVYEQ